MTMYAYEDLFPLKNICLTIIPNASKLKHTRIFFYLDTFQKHFFLSLFQYKDSGIVFNDHLPVFQETF